MGAWRRSSEASAMTPHCPRRRRGPVNASGGRAGDGAPPARMQGHRESRMRAEGRDPRRPAAAGVDAVPRPAGARGGFGPVGGDGARRARCPDLFTCIKGVARTSLLAGHLCLGTSACRIPGRSTPLFALSCPSSSRQVDPWRRSPLPSPHHFPTCNSYSGRGYNRRIAVGLHYAISTEERCHIPPPPGLQPKCLLKRLPGPSLDPCALLAEHPDCTLATNFIPCTAPPLPQV